VKIEEHVGLDRFTTIGTGGPARWFAQPRSFDELAELLGWAAAEGHPVETIGLGSNVLVHDDGVDALVLRLTGALADVRVEGDQVVAGGGATNAVCLHRARDAGLAGFEFASAIPGTVGGGVRMNAGAYGRDFRAVLAEALVVSAAGARKVRPDELELAYRSSNLDAGDVVAQVRLQLEPSHPVAVRAEVAALLAQRKRTQPTNKRTFGSVFKNPDNELSAGRMLEACGLKGHRIGGAQISPKHANFIENAGDARTEDALALIAEARRRAREQFGVDLAHEVQLLGDIAIE